MEVLILGTGCPNCQKLERNTKEAAKEISENIEIKKVDDMEEILSYGVMSIPALIKDGEIVVSGRVPNTKEIVELLS